MTYQPDPQRSEWIHKYGNGRQVHLFFTWAPGPLRNEVKSVCLEFDGQWNFFVPSMLRDIPFTTILKQLRQEMEVARKSESDTFIKFDDSRFIFELKRGPDQGRTLTADDLQVVADLYKEAFRGGLPVQRYVAETLGVALPTAARRIALARRQGLIPPISELRAARREAADGE